MIDDAMAGERIVGMVQTRPGGDRMRPFLAPVGCAGRITSYAETPDGRYLITLTGVCRFRVGDELPAHTPYRQVKARFDPYEQDLRPGARVEFDRERLLAALRVYLNRRGLDVDWGAAEEAPADALVTSLAMGLPFEPAEKQVLLEAETADERCETLLTLLEIDAARASGEERDPSMH
jgi:hypothetical protein